MRLSSQCTRVRLSAGKAAAGAAAGVLGAGPHELAVRRAARGGDPGTSSAQRQRFGSEALGILTGLAHFGPAATYSVSGISLQGIKTCKRTTTNILYKFRLRS